MCMNACKYLTDLLHSKRLHVNECLWEKLKHKINYKYFVLYLQYVCLINYCQPQILKIIMTLSSFY